MRDTAAAARVSQDPLGWAQQQPEGHAHPLELPTHEDAGARRGSRTSTRRGASPGAWGVSAPGGPVRRDRCGGCADESSQEADRGGSGRGFPRFSSCKALRGSVRSSRWRCTWRPVTSSASAKRSRWSATSDWTRSTVPAGASVGTGTASARRGRLLRSRPPGAGVLVARDALPRERHLAEPRAPGPPWEDEAAGADDGGAALGEMRLLDAQGDAGVHDERAGPLSELQEFDLQSGCRVNKCGRGGPSRSARRIQPLAGTLQGCREWESSPSGPVRIVRGRGPACDETA